MHNHTIKKGACLLLAGILAFSLTIQPVKAVAATDYSAYSNTRINFGLGLHTDHTRPSGDRPAGITLPDYNAFYYGTQAWKKRKPIIYLTFDCGYENGNTKNILKTLKKYDVKAIFFVTEPFIRENTKLVKKMKKQGHLVGNHTINHPALTDCSVSRIQKEINGCAKTMKKLTGYEMDPFIRPPMGVYSTRVLKVIQDMGYSTFLWSLAWYDYDEANQPGKDYVVNMFKKYYFDGMIPLIHVISKSDTEALPEIIEFLQKKGYSFDTVDTIVEKHAIKIQNQKDKNK